MAKLKYKRVLIKLSGEVFKGNLANGIEGEALLNFAKEIKKIHSLGVEVGVVIGGGNIWRYRDNKHLSFDRVTSDTMGMIATLMNALALESALESIGVSARAMSSFPCPKAMEDYTIKKAKHHLIKKKRVLVFAGGTGSPFFTTDSAAALRALELDCDVLLKATKVDYVYDKDPMKFKNAKKFTDLNYKKIITENLNVMDLTCASLCMEGRLPILVFNIGKKGILEKAVKGEKVGTKVS